MPARPRFAISGILAGGIPGFGIATFFAWHLSAHPGCDGLVLLLLRWMTCPGRGTQAAWSLRFMCSLFMFIPRPGRVFFCLFVSVFVLVVLFLFGWCFSCVVLFLLFLSCGMTL